MCVEGRGVEGGGALRKVKQNTRECLFYFLTALSKAEHSRMFSFVCVCGGGGGGVKVKQGRTLVNVF